MRELIVTFHTASFAGMTHKWDSSGALAFIKKHGVIFPNLIGEPEKVAELFLKLTGVDLTGTPAILIYSPWGKLLAAQLGAVPTFLINNFINQNKDKADK